jgi:hypothetical protein
VVLRQRFRWCSRNRNIDAEGGAIADLAIRAVANRSLLRVRVAFDPDVAAVARAIDFHGFAPFAKSGGAIVSLASWSAMPLLKFEDKILCFDITVSAQFFA